MTRFMTREQALRVLARFARDMKVICATVGIQVDFLRADPETTVPPIYSSPERPRYKSTFTLTGPPKETAHVDALLTEYLKSEKAFEHYTDTTGDLLVWRGSEKARLRPDQLVSFLDTTFGAKKWTLDGKEVYAKGIPGMDEPDATITDLMGFDPQLISNLE